VGEKSEKKVSIAEYLKTLKKVSKSDDIPGTVLAYLDEICPVSGCGRKLKLKKCCGNKQRKECICGYKEIDTANNSI